jgi:hypothetical protein
MVGLDVARLFLKTRPLVCGQVSAAGLVLNLGISPIFEVDQRE